jgi:alpha-methylacyl-CoA racemase
MGPLAGVKVVELQGIGPGPYCGMMLADMGADIIRIDRAQAARPKPATTTSAGIRVFLLFIDDLSREMRGTV